MKPPYIPYRHLLTKRAQILRKNITPFEKIMWYKILHLEPFTQYKFLRQKPLLNYIVDFYCSELQLVIEIDGESHLSQVQYDNIRTQQLEKYGLRVVRYSNLDVKYNTEWVYEDLCTVVSPPLNSSYLEKPT